MKNQLSIVIEADKSVDEYELINEIKKFLISLNLKIEVVGTHVKVIREDYGKSY